MAIKTAKSGAYGDEVTGRQVYGGVSTILTAYQTAPIVGGVPTTAPGWGRPGGRTWARPGFFTFTAPNVAPSPTVGVTVTTQGGAFVGRIRSDVQRTIIRSVEFTLDDHGCADFKIMLNELPSFPILPFSRIYINLGSTVFQWYCGIITNQPELGTKSGDGWELSGFGLRRYLEKLKDDADYVAVTDVGAIVDDLAQNYIPDFSAIEYNPSKIDQVTGVLTVNTIELSKHPLNKVLDNFAVMANRHWGVDGDGDLFFQDIYGAPLKTLYVGYHMQEFNPKLNVEAVRNSIFIQRSQGKGSGGSGWIVETILNDATSIAKYGKAEWNYQVPGTFGSAECAIIAQALLDRAKDPPMSAEAKDVPVLTGDDYYKAGTYRVVMPPQDFEDIVSEMDTVTGWTTIGPGDLAFSVSTVPGFYASGAGSIKLDWVSALGDVAELTLSPKYTGFIKRVRLWVRGSKTGNLFTMGIGNATWNQYTVAPAVNVAGAFYLVDWDVSAFNVRNIGKFGIQIDDATLTAGSLWIDKLEVLGSGSKVYTLDLKKAKYRLTPESQSVDLEFGEVPPKMENYLAGLMATANEMKFTGEVR